MPTSLGAWPFKIPQGRLWVEDELDGLAGGDGGAGFGARRFESPFTSSLLSLPGEVAVDPVRIITFCYRPEDSSLIADLDFDGDNYWSGNSGADAFGDAGLDFTQGGGWDGYRRVLLRRWRGR